MKIFTAIKIIFATIVVFIVIISCGALEPDTHDITIENRRNESADIHCDYSAGETFKYFTVAKNETKTTSIESNKSYHIVIGNSSGTWSTFNNEHNIYIIIPTSGEPYVK